MFASISEGKLNLQPQDPLAGQAKPLEKHITPINQPRTPLNQHLNPLDQHLNPLEQQSKPLVQQIKPLVQQIKPFASLVPPSAIEEFPHYPEDPEPIILASVEEEFSADPFPDESESLKVGEEDPLSKGLPKIPDKDTRLNLSIPAPAFHGKNQLTLPNSSDQNEQRLPLLEAKNGNLPPLMEKEGTLPEYIGPEENPNVAPQ